MFHLKTFLTCSGLISQRLKRCPPLPPIVLPKIAYEFDQLRTWLESVEDYSDILNTEEFQAQMRFLLSEMLDDTFPDYATYNDCREDFRKAIAVQMDLRLSKEYPNLEKFGRVEYRRHGGPDDPGCRFIFQPHVGGKGRELTVVMKGHLRRSRISSVHALRILAQNGYLERWEKIRNAPKSGTLIIERYSGFDGFQKARTINPTIRLDRVADGKLHTIISARKKTLLSHGPVLKALEEHLPAKIIFRNPDRLGREYFQSTLGLFAELGIEIEFDEYTAPTGHCHPGQSEIQRDNRRLDGFVFIHQEKLKGLVRKVADQAARIRDRYLIKRSDLLQLGQKLRSVANLNLKRYGNGLVELCQIILNDDKQSYLINAPP
jgi:hypothetical protein